MTGTETIAKRLRCFDYAKTKCKGDIFAFALDEHINCSHSESCRECLNGLAIKLADAIEAEQAHAVSKALIEEAAKQENMDSVLLYNAAKDLQENAHIIKESVLEDLAHCAGLIRKALKGAKPQLPEGVIWHTYEDGELVKPFDKLPGFDSGGVQKFIWTSSHNGAWQLQDAEGHMLNVMHGEPVKRPESEVLGADGVPIKEGDTVYHEDEGECVVERIYRQNGDTLLDLDVCGAIWNVANVKPAEVTHRKPDTQEAIDHDAALLVSESFFDQRRDEFEDRVFDLLKRQRKLLGGE